MLAHYGYRDASGDFFITINTDRCDGCGNCVKVCPVNIFRVFYEDPNDPMREKPIALPFLVEFNYYSPIFNQN